VRAYVYNGCMVVAAKNIQGRLAFAGGMTSVMVAGMLLLSPLSSRADDTSIGRASGVNEQETANKTASIPPEQVQVSTPSYKPQFSEFDPPLGTYTYEVSWGGIPAAEAVVEVSQEGDSYRITASAKTFSAIDLFYTLRYRAVGEISAVDLRPEFTKITQLENSKVRSLDMRFHQNGDIEATRTSQRQGRDKKTDSVRFNPNNGTLDPFSASFLARSLEWKLGETKEFDTFNGQTRYLISLTAEDKRTIEVGGVEREVWVIVPTVKNLSSNRAHEKLRRAEIFVTADKAREIVQISSSVFVGTVNTTLESFEPAPPQSEQVRLALQRTRELTLADQG
jgi:hypothetical protein